jgi:hypothetical protein
MPDWTKTNETNEWVIYSNKNYPRVHISARPYDVNDAHATVTEGNYSFHYFKDGTTGGGNPSQRIRTLLAEALRSFLSENNHLLRFAQKSLFSQSYDYEY